MQKCLPLNLLQPTKAKQRLLKETYRTFFRMVEELLPLARRAKRRAQLQRENYENLRSRCGVASQLVLEAIFYAWNHRETINGKMHRCVVRFDKRLFSFGETRRWNPVVSLRTNRKRRIATPINRDGAYKRFLSHINDGWTATSIIMKQNLRFLVILKKESPETSIRPNWMGIDVNSSKIAISIIGGEKVLKQTYFGQDVSMRQFRFEERRAKLQKYRDTVSRGKAGIKLKRLSGKQRNYVRTRMWQIANEIVKLAKEFNANIVIEKLRYLRKRRGEWSRKSRKKVNRIPYGFFRHALKHVAEREGIIVREIKSNYTSQTCPRCRHVGGENWVGYVYFRCAKCGYEADRDRVASLNIAERADNLFRCPHVQSPLGNAPVNGHAWKDEEVERQRPFTSEFQALSFREG